MNDGWMGRFDWCGEQATSARDLFAAIESVTLSSGEISELLAGGSLWSPDSARDVEVQYPESYD